MDTENQVVSESTTQNSSVGSKKCNHIPIIVALAILAVCGFAFGGFELYNNLQSKNQTGSSETEYSNNNENVIKEDGNRAGNSNNNESVIREDDNRASTVVSGNASFAVPNPPYDEGTNDGTVKFEYGIYNDILFAYSINYHLHPYGNIVSEVISNNVDTDTGEKLSNTKVLERVNISIEEVYRKILENLADTVSVDSFLLNTQGDVSGETISINDFKNNISEYVEQLKDKQDGFYILLKDSKIAVSYVQNEILEELGMSSHMNHGLVGGYVEVEL